MKIKIHPTVIFRTPKFSYQANLLTSWDELKKAISISSDAFYQTIKDVQENEISALPPKIYFTIWKYFNRAKFRSTPYGTFASFSLLTNAIKGEATNLVINEQQQISEFIDWPFKNNLEFPFLDLFNKDCLLFSNSSYYEIAGNIRYIACTDGLFELAEIGADNLVKQILDNCLSPIKITDLIKKLDLNTEDQESLAELLEDMHSIQLIFTEYDPNIMGEDYFQRINIVAESNMPKYLIAKREVVAGNIDEKLLQAVPGLINLLQGITPKEEKEALKKFIGRYKKKFDLQEIPLLIALDPELGVGYDELEQAGLGDDFISKLNSKQVQKKSENTVRTVLQSTIKSQQFEKGKTLFLNKLPFKLNEDFVKLPNTFSLLMSVVDDLICVDQIGGSTANALSGRFTMADLAVETNSKSVAESEQAANPDVLFFDVAYMVETNIDNINRRKLSYNHQLSILNFDTSDNPLTLNDILISVQGEEVILRSKKYNKRIIPKMASAYNYTRSDLSVFRLLCDLQYQGIQAGLSLPIDSIFPDLDYYPRIQYQNIILSSSKWLVNRENLSSPENSTTSFCRNFLLGIGVTRYFKAGLSDQTLCFDLNSDDDLFAFTQFMQKQKSTYLEEVIMPVESNIKDQNDKPYMAQIILNLYHNEEIYRGLNQHISSANTGCVKAAFPPGSEWLYFEIYCHQQRSDQILSETIQPFLSSHADKIKSWFFIRYNENGNHLRFRILLNNKEDGQLITSEFSSVLGDKLIEGLVSDLQIKTYKRELERYGQDLIEQAECHFYHDSNFVLSVLETHLDPFMKYNLCASLMLDIQDAEVIENLGLINLVKWMSDSFNTEHHLEAADFKQMNVQYQLYRKFEYPILTQDQKSLYELMTASFLNILKECLPQKRQKLIGDLIHMHVNRLFNKDQRTHEMVMYYFLLKEIQRKNAMKN